MHSELLGWLIIAAGLSLMALVVEGRVKPLFAWYDLWVGAYWDRANRRLYVLPLPCLGIVIDFG